MLGILSKRRNLFSLQRSCIYSNTYPIKYLKRNFSSNNTSPKFGLFSDIHFQQKGLERIKQTGKWIIDEFKNQNVNAIICLGDVVNTRESINVQVLSSVLEFFDQLCSLSVPIHVIVGNHDLYLKRETWISSLDFLQFREIQKSQNIKLYKNITLDNVCGEACLFMPFQEDQSVFLQKLDSLEKEIGTSNLKKIIGFGHLAIDGAHIYSEKTSTFKGSISSKDFSRLKRTFSGHFHVFQELKHNFTYLGSPLQFNFGDTGEDRGILIYDSQTDTINRIINPFCHAFRKIKESEIEFAEENPGLFKNCFVMVEFLQSTSSQKQEEIKNRLLKLGVLDVKKESVITQVLKQSKVNLKSEKIEDLLSSFLESVSKNVNTKAKQGEKWQQFLQNPKHYQNLLQTGNEIIKESRSLYSTQHNSKMFSAELSHLVIQDFMGVQGKIEIPFSQLQDGIWVFEGPNGSGKSTIVEAITWCQFGQFLRSDMSKDFAINDNAKSCFVQLYFSNGFMIERSRKKGGPDVLKTYQAAQNKNSGETELTYLAENEQGELRYTQAFLEATLGIDMNTYSKSIVLGQGILNNFVSSNTEQRREIIEQCLGLEKFNTYFEYAKSKKQEFENSCTLESRSLDKIQTELNELEFTLTELGEEKKLIAKLKKLKNQQEEINSQFLKLKTELELSLNALQNERLAIQNEKKNLGNIVENNNRAKTLGKGLSKLAQILKDKIVVLESFLQTKQCATCKQPITEPLFENVKTEIAQTVYQEIKKFEKNSSLSSNLQSELKLFPSLNSLKSMQEKELNEVLEKFENIFKKESLTLENFSSEQLSLWKATSDKENMISEKIFSIKDQISKLTKQNSDNSHKINLETQNLQNQVDQYESIKENCLKKIKLLKENQANAQKVISDLEEQITSYTFWEAAFHIKHKESYGFSSFRAFILEKAVVSLNQIFSTYMEKLSEDSLPLSLTLTPSLEFRESYGKRSGGERKRSDLVTLLALFELVRQQNRYVAEYLILDEVFDALDVKGQQAIQSLLEILKEKVKKVLVVTHSDIISGSPVAGHIKFEMKKDDKGKPLGSKMEIIKS